MVEVVEEAKEASFMPTGVRGLRGFRTRDIMLREYEKKRVRAFFVFDGNGI